MTMKPRRNDAVPALKQQPAKTLKAKGKTAHPVRPVGGEIDYEAMRKDIMAKFPKTLARLAE
jgi:hypothetical protein